MAQLDKTAKKEKAAEKASKVKQPVVKENKALGVSFHMKENPFADSNRKVKGSDITQGEAHWLVGHMHGSKAKSWDEFIKKVVEPAWNDEDGRHPFSAEAAHKYLGKILDAIQSQGVATVDVNQASPDKTRRS